MNLNIIITINNIKYTFNYQFMYALTDEYDESEDVQHLVDNYDIYMVPVMNPDGYSYTRTNVSRMIVAQIRNCGSTSS